MPEPILILAGTNRPGAKALKIARILEQHYRKTDWPAEVFSLAELPPEIFNPASYAKKPESFLPIQQKVLAAPGLHIVTPEYNGSFPGVLKYFIDMLKFPESFERKPVAFTGEALGMWGAIRSVEQLQMIFGYRNAHLFPERVFIPGVDKKLTQDDAINDPDLDARLAHQAAGFATFVGRVQS